MVKSSLFRILLCSSLLLLTNLYAIYEEIPDLTTTPLLNPALVNEKKARIRLPNGLEAILVSNPTITQSAVNLVVKIGSWHDPEEHQGLAHFLEHMLFLGTEEYPVEMEFARFLSQHSGKMNAYTTSDYTSYQFAVPKEALNEALKRFSSFFKSPLLSQSGVTRELNAIDQEFAKSFNSEGKLGYQLLKNLMDPDHPGHRFNSGNSVSLAKATPDDLRAFFNANYSPEKMRLYVLSSLPLESLKEMVDQDFSSIPKRQPNELNLVKPMFKGQSLGKVIFASLPKQIFSLSIVFEMPPSYPQDLDSEPDELITYILENKDAGSLLAYLKNEGLAEEIDATMNVFENRARLYEVTFNLTEKGYKEYQKVIEAFYGTINLMRKTPYPIELYDELSLLKKQRYQYMEYDEPFLWARQQGEWLAREPLETYPERSLLLGPFDASAVKKFLDLLHPEQALYILFAPEKKIQIDLNQKEPWMDIHFTAVPISDSEIKLWNQVESNEKILLNNPNPWIAKNIESTSQLPSRDHFPKDLKQEIALSGPGILFYYAPDSLYHLPRSYIKLSVESPLIQEGKPKRAALADLFAKMLEIELEEMILQAKSADASIKIEHVPGALQITLEGFTDSILRIYPFLLKRIPSFNFSDEQLERAKEILEKQYQNELLDMPLYQAFDYFKAALLKEHVTSSQKRNLLKSVDREVFTEFKTDFLKKTYLKAIATGSLDREEASKLAALTDSQFHKVKGSISNPFYPKVQSLEQCKGACKLNIQTKAQGNALMIALETKGFSAELRNCQQLLSLAMWEAFFTELRTKQQTGYMVASDSVDLYRHLFSYFAIQSSTYLPDELIWRFEQFFESYLRRIRYEEIDANRFETLKNGLSIKLSEPPGSLTLYGELLYKLAFDIGDFSWLSKRLHHLAKMPYEDFIQSAENLLSRENERRIAIAIFGNASKDLFKYTTLNSLSTLRQIKSGKHGVKKAYPKKDL